MMGLTARILATEALPHTGGALPDGSDPHHATALLAALMGPVPPDLH